MSTRLTPAKRKAEALTLLESPQISALFERVRVAGDVAPDPTPQRKKSSLPAAVGIGLLCAISWWCFGGMRSGALRATLPGGSHAGNPAIGETCLYRGDFYPNSGIETLQQLDAIKTSANGLGSAALVARRIAAPVFANLFTAAFDSYYAPVALNLVLCWFGAWLVARTTSVLFHDRTKSLLAATSFSLSIVATSLVGELGPPMLGLCFSYLWTLLLVRYDADDARLGWRGAIGLAVLLGLWSLADVSALTGLIVYAVFGLKRRKFAPVVLAAMCWIGFPIAQELIWRRLGFVVAPSADLWHVWAALQHHAAWLAADPLGYLGFLTLEFGNLLFRENPLIVVICLLGLGLVSHKSKWLLGVCFFAPMLVQLVLFPGASKGSTTIAGNTIVLIVLASHAWVEAGRRLQSRFGAEAFAIPLVALVAVQAAWGYSGLLGWDFPAKEFAAGPFREGKALGPTTYARLAGSPREIPTVLGGPVRATQFCGLAADRARPPLFPIERVAPYRNNWSGRPAVRRLLEVQALVLGALLIAIVCLMRIWPGIGTALLLSGCVGASVLCGSTTGFVPQSFAAFEGRIAIGADEKLVGAVRLSPEFQERLQDATENGEEVELFVRMHPVNAEAEHAAEFQVAEWSSADSRILVPAQAFEGSVRARGGRVEFAITAASTSKGLLFHSWQSTRPNGERVAEIVHADGTHETLDSFPSFEIRVVRPSGNYAFQKLNARFEQSPSDGYWLIGY